MQIKRLWSVLIVILFLILLLETYIILRDLPIYYHLEVIDESPIRYRPNDSKLDYILKPNSSVHLAGTNVKINSLGFRDYEYNVTTEKYRIAVLGDSFTFGYGTELEDTYPKLLEKRYRNEIEVLNFGGNGGNTLLEAHYLNETVLSFKPDLVIVGFFPNDADSEDSGNEELCNAEILTEYINYPITETYLRYTEEYEGMRAEINSIFTRIKHRNEIRYFYNLYLEDAIDFRCMKKGVAMFSDIAKTNELEIVFIIIPVKTPNDTYSEMFELIYKKVAEIIRFNNMNAHILDYGFIGYDARELYTKIGPPHYNKKGNMIISDTVYNILEKEYNLSSLVASD